MRRVAFSLTLLLAGLGAVRAAHAQPAGSDASDLRGLLEQNVVTTASKSAETSTTAPATSSTLTAEDIHRYGLRSVAEAIDFLSLGAVTSYPLSTAEVGARGVLLSADSGDHFLLLIDGHAVNEPLFGTAHFDRGMGVPIEMVDHIEMILGPGSVLYGSNAMLGVINVITKRAKDWHGTHVGIEGEGGPLQQDTAHLANVPDSVRSQLDGWQTSNAIGLTAWRVMGGAGYEFPLFGKTAAITAAVEYFQQDGPAFTFGPEHGGIDIASAGPLRYTRPPLPATGWWGGLADRNYYSRIPGAQLHVSWAGFDLSVHASTFKRAVPYRARFTHPVEDFNDQDSYDLDRSLWVDLRHHAALSSTVEVTSRAYADTWDLTIAQNASEVSECIGLPLVGSNPTCTYKGNFASRWAGLEEQISLDWLKDGSLVTLVGADGRLRFVGSKFDLSDFNTGQPVASSFGLIHQNDQLLGAYAQQTWQPARWLGLNAGARLDEETRYQGNVSPRVAASVRAWDGGTFKAIYAEAFRSPAWVETNLATPQQIQSSGLSPERVRSVEGSFEQRFGSQRLLVGAFRSWWSNLVELHVLTPAETTAAAHEGLINGVLYYGIVQFRNVSSIDNYGFNALYEGSAGESQQLRWGATVTGAIARRNDDSLPGSPSEPLTVGPQVFGNARISYKLPGDWPSLAVAAHWMGQRYADRAFDGAWPPSQLPIVPPQVQLRFTLSGPVPGISGLGYRLGVDWSAVDRGPYVVGPIQDSSYKGEPPRFVPVDTFRVLAGLKYDLLQ
jgi:outer membrane receptor protein involved in Fe transport